MHAPDREVSSHHRRHTDRELNTPRCLAFYYLELKLSLSLGLMKLMYVAFLPTVHQRMTIWVNPDSLCKLPKHKPYGVWLLNPCTLL